MDRAETPLYAAIRAGLARLEREARRHAEVIDRLVDRNAAASATAARSAPYQETLYLQCVSQGRSGGRFRCINRRAKRAAVASLIRPFTLNGEALAETPTLSLRPSAFFLDPGESRVAFIFSGRNPTRKPAHAHGPVTDRVVVSLPHEFF